MNINKKKSIKILVAEDDEDDKNFICEAFKNLKILNSVNFVENGEELLKYLKSSSKLPDIIFMDLHMPVMNGFKAISEIKKDKNWRKIPIIVLTTSREKKDIECTYSKGISAYIVKPFTFEDLLKIIRETTNYYFEIVTLPTEGE